MSPSEVQAVKQAFADWSKATGLNFVEVASTDTADITVGMGSFDTSNTGVVGFTTFRAKAGHIQPGATVRVEDVSEDPLVSGADGTSVYGGTDATFSQVLLHEIGHALGFGDNADPTSVESYYLSAANRTLSNNDIAQAAALYGSGSAAGNVVHQLIHAMSSFAPAPMVSTVAANDPSASVSAVHYGGNQLMQRANAN
jgi:predicted Zn-dependent protease